MFSGIPETQANLIVALFAATSVFAAILAAAWPKLMPNPFGDRLRQVASEAGRGGRATGDRRLALITRPRQLLQDIFDKMNLSSQAENGELAKRLRMAGYRGEGPVVTYLVIRLLAPPIFFAVTLFYVFVVLQLSHPFFVKFGIATAAACLGYFLPALLVRNMIIKRQKAIRRAWPDALDLILICVESGMSIERAFQKVAEEVGMQSAVMAEELDLTTAELAHFPERRKAYENLALRTGVDGVRSVVTALIQAEKYGSGIGQALRVLAQESRDTRMAEAEKKAAALPPKLTVPMIIFFLPVLFAVVVTPAAIQIASVL